MKHLPGTGPHKPLLLLVNFDWALEPPRPVAPSTKYLGPLMPTPPAQLPDNIQAWLDMQPDLPGAQLAFICNGHSLFLDGECKHLQDQSMWV